MTVVSSLLGVSAFFSVSASLATCGLAAAGVSLPTEASAALPISLSLGFAALAARVFASGLASSDLALAGRAASVLVVEGLAAEAGSAGAVLAEAAGTSADLAPTDLASAGFEVSESAWAFDEIGRA